MSKHFTFGSLFSGIGGIDLGLERASWHCEWQVENDPFCQKVLTKHWPNVTRYGDIRGLDTSTLRRVDLIAGGFPCQPHSLAGQRKASADERNLWPEFARIIRELRPRWVLAENVMGILSSEGGNFFGKVLGDLAQAGYDAQWIVLSAAQFGAPHLRERIFIVAHSASTGSQERSDTTGVPTEPSTPSSMGHTDCSGRQEQYIATIAEGTGDTPWRTRSPGSVGQFEPRVGRDSARLSPRVDGHHRWPARLGEQQHDWEPPRVITDCVSDRAKRLKALGNAVVPQVAQYIGQLILESEICLEQNTH